MKRSTITNEDGKALRLVYDDYGALINKGGEIWQYDAERNPVRKLKADKSDPSVFVYDNQNSLCMKAAPDADTSDDRESLIDPLGNYVWRYRYYPDAALTGNMSRRISPSGREMRFYYDGGRILNEEGFFSRIAAGSNAPVNAGEGITLPDSSGFQKVTHLATFIYGAEPTPAGIDTTPPNSPPDEICINYYLADKNNSIIALTDSMGNVIKEYTYNDFGERLEINTETTVNPHTGYDPIGFEGKNENLKETPNITIYNMPQENRIVNLMQNYKDTIIKGSKVKESYYQCYDFAFAVNHKYFLKYIQNQGYSSATIKLYKFEMDVGLHYGTGIILTDSEGKTHYCYSDFNHPGRNCRRMFTNEFTSEAALNNFIKREKGISFTYESDKEFLRQILEIPRIWLDNQLKNCK